MAQNEKKPSEIINDFLDLMSVGRERYLAAKEECDILDSFERTEYWNHMFEFARDKAERNRLATAYQRERKKRREYKDIMDLYKNVNNFSSSENNKPVIKRLSGMLPLQVHQEEYLASNRVYKGKGGDSGANNYNRGQRE